MLTPDVQIQPDMITLDPEFVGSMAPPTKLTTDINGKSDTPFARLPRQHRLKLQGRADETEEVSEEKDGDEGEEGKAAREKKRMRGKNKAMKRYLRKQRKNVVDPKAVGISSLRPFFPPFTVSPEGGTPRQAAERERTTEEGQRCSEGRTGRQTTKRSRPFPDLECLACKVSRRFPAGRTRSVVIFILCCPVYSLVVYRARWKSTSTECTEPESDISCLGLFIFVIR